MSRRVARFNKRVTNPIQGTYAWLLPPWAVVIHRGRRSGRLYRTPVVGFTRDGQFATAILYGERTQWVRNLIATGEGELVRGGRTYPLTDCRVVDAADAGPELAASARAYGRASGKLLVGRLGAPGPGFGRGPAKT